jgi:hypothetical protein
MRTNSASSEKREMVFLSQTDLEVLIYMCTDAWITPDLKKFKNEILEKVEKENPRKG